jgi:hypothetical protein
MAVGGHDEREAAHARPPPWIARQQRRLRLRLFQVLQDRERLE